MKIKYLNRKCTENHYCVSNYFTESDNNKSNKKQRDMMTVSYIIFV